MPLKTEAEAKLEELQPLEKESWDMIKAYEESREYKEALAKHAFLTEKWYVIQRQITALKSLTT